MKLITEISEELEYISETTKEGKEQFKIRGIFMQAEQQNRNKRTYPLKVLENEVKRYNKEYSIRLFKCFRKISIKLFYQIKIIHSSCYK